ncbi:type II secretion system protein N [Novosphingopyxis sp.]|uniref:type II secretion system protein N n=1 Tax=Novosphingopyxis sp. TaxID=2709690 RepID=UPI003B5A3F78
MRSLFETGFRTDRLRSLPRPSLFALFFSIALLALLIQIARLVWTVVTPISPVGDWRPASAVVLPLATRQALFTSFNPFSRGAKLDEGQAVVTSLQIELFGILMNGSSGLGSAIIAGSDGIQNSYVVGEEIQSGVTLVGVAFDHVVVSRGGTQERVYLDQSVPAEVVGAGSSPSTGGTAGAKPLGTSDATVSSTGNPPRTVENLNKFVALNPRTVGGRITGVVAAPSGDVAGYRAMGFLPGDIITAVNGRQIKSASDAAFVQQQIKPGARLSLMVERGAQTVPLALNLEQ